MRLSAIVTLVVAIGCGPSNPPVHPTPSPCNPQNDHWCGDGSCCTDELPSCLGPDTSGELYCQAPYPPPSPDPFYAQTKQPKRGPRLH